jgi:limonene-1,2-epoxide hydrolase
MTDLVTTVRTVIEAVTRKDLETAPVHFTEDCRHSHLPTDSVTGPAGIRVVLEPFFAPIIANALIMLQSAVEGEPVFTERLDRHEIGTGWVKLPETGVFVFRSAKIAVWREHFDLGALLRQWPAMAADQN